MTREQEVEKFAGELTQFARNELVVRAVRYDTGHVNIELFALDQDEQVPGCWASYIYEYGPGTWSLVVRASATSVDLAVANLAERLMSLGMAELHRPTSVVCMKCTRDRTWVIPPTDMILYQHFGRLLGHLHERAISSSDPFNPSILVMRARLEGFFKKIMKDWERVVGPVW